MHPFQFSTEFAPRGEGDPQPWGAFVTADGGGDWGRPNPSSGDTLADGKTMVIWYGNFASLEEAQSEARRNYADLCRYYSAGVNRWQQQRRAAQP